MHSARALCHVSLFSGCGGFDLGFEQAGFRCLGGFDVDPNAAVVFQQNGVRPCNVVDLSGAPKLVVSRRPDVVLAGPPCQGFSTLGKRDANDPRNRLIEIAAGLAIDLKPQVIVLENVAGATSGALACYWRRTERLLQRSGYRTSTHVLTSADYGVAQIRRRAVLFAWKSKSQTAVVPLRESLNLKAALNGVSKAENHDPKRLHSGTTDYLIASQIKPNQKLCNVRAGVRSVPTWNIPDVFGATTRREREVLAVIQRLRRQLRQRETGDADPLLISEISKYCGRAVSTEIRRLHVRGYLRQFGDRFDLAHTFNGKFRRLAWEQLAPAVDTRFGEPRYFLHPDEHRGLSVREAARIQGFPDSFIFSGPRAAQFRMVGNAVPPPLAQQIAIAVRDQLL